MEQTLKNPKFWVGIVALVVMFLSQFIPGFSVDQQAAVSGMLLMVAYIYGIIKDPGPANWASVLQSRKFWATLIGEVALWLTAFHVYPPFGLSYEQIIDMITAIASALVIAFANTNPSTPFPQPTDPLARSEPPSAK